jgi:hypothetical protein
MKTMDSSLTTSRSLSSLRDFFTQERILICFNGPTSRSLIGEIGVALKEHIESTRDCVSSAMDVFSVYIEMSQNIRHYTASRGYNDQDATATVVIAETGSDRYVVSAGNMIDANDGQNLMNRVRDLAQRDKAELKSLYKEQLRKPREDGVVTGAGLGLIDIARKSSEPLQASLDELGGGKAFFTLRATI